MKEVIRKYALQNAVKYNGKASVSAIVGKVLKELPSLKSNISKITDEIRNIVEEVNLLSLEDQIRELKRSYPKLLEEKKEKKRELPELKNKKNIVMRFAPSPSGPLHIGHAYVLTLNSEYCKKYKGKLILRIEDTNPENIYQDAYKLIEEDVKWLTNNKISKVIIQSDRLEIYYDYAEKLLQQENAYVCTCDQEKFKELIIKKIACPCRNLPIKEHLLRFDKMFIEYKPGEAVLRIKTNIQDPNPAMRDWPALRINDHEHPRTKTKYKVWPLMNFAVAIDDHELKITHSIRGKDHIDNAKRQQHIFKYLKWNLLEDMFVGRINFIGLNLSTTETRKLIDYKKFSGWDDIKLPFLLALKRRGYQPEAFIKYALDMGINQSDKTVTKEEFFKILNAHNKDIIEPKSNRYFFVDNPVKIKIENAPSRNVKIALHPDFPKRGYRKFKTKNEFYISKSDFDEIRENNLYRLMGCLNFIKKGNKIMFDSLERNKFKEEGYRIMHWLPVSKDLINVEVLMDDGKIIKGIAESNIKKLKPGTIVQFERRFFCKLDREEKDKLIFWYTHK